MRYALVAVIVVSAPALTTYVAPFVSIITALFARCAAPPWVKAVINLLLSAISATVTIAIQSGDVLILDSRWFKAFLLTYVLSVAAYYGLWKPTGVAGKVAEKTDAVGIGPTNP